MSYTLKQVKEIYWAGVEAGRGYERIDTHVVGGKRVLPQDDTACIGALSILLEVFAEQAKAKREAKKTEVPTAHAQLVMVL